MFAKLSKYLAAFCMLGLSSGSQAVTVLADDFSSGNPVSGTDYALISAGSFSQPGQYRVVSNPSTAFTNGYVSYFDHTLGTASGEMLFFDGAPDTRAIWTQGVPLTSGIEYTFSYWASSGGPGSTPVVGLLIDGANVGKMLTTNMGSWTQFTHSFTPSTTGVRTFSIVDLNFQPLGNDGAIDDVLLSTVPEPPLVGLLLAGLTIIGALSRHRRIQTLRECVAR